MAARLIEKLKSGRLLQAEVLLGLLALILLRNLAVFDQISFWAEDADEFFAGSLNLGLKSLITPVYGYHFFLGRALAYLTSLFPLAWAPALYAGISALINAFVVSYFSREGFAWILPDRSKRILVCALLALAPGSPEVFLNIVNLSTPLSFLALLLLLEKPFKPSGLKIAGFALLAISAGQVFLFTPLVLYLWFATGKKRYFWLCGVILPVTLINFLGNHSVGQQTGLLDYGHGVSAPKIILEQGFIRFFMAPFLGAKLTPEVMRAPGAVFWILFVLISVLFFIKLPKSTKPDREKLMILGLAYFCCAASFGVIAVARSYAFDQVSRESGYLAWNGRYSFLTGAMATLIWAAILTGEKKSWNKSRIARAALVLISLNLLAHWNAKNLRPDPEFGKKAGQLETTLQLAKQGALPVPAITDPFIVAPGYYHHSRMSVVVHPDASVATLGTADSAR